MTRLHDLCREQGQSPWLDNLKRGYLTSGQLKRMVADGIRGLTANPTIFAKAIEGSADYDEQFRTLVGRGAGIEESYWSMVVADISAALDILRPVYDQSDGVDGYVSVEVAPELANDAEATVEAARELHRRIDEPNLFVKIPATAGGIPAIRQMISEGHSTNITLIFSLDRYDDVVEAYLSGLEYRAEANLPLAPVRSVASFFVSRVDTEVDRRLEAIGTPEALALRGRTAVAQAQCAYALFQQRFSGPRWDALATEGAKVQRPLWASTSTKSPEYPDTLYIDNLIGPDTVNTMPEATIEAFEDHGTVARAIDADIPGARRVLADVEACGVDLDDVGRVLEEEGVAAFSKSFDELLAALRTKAVELSS